MLALWDGQFTSLVFKSPLSEIFLGSLGVVSKLLGHCLLPLCLCFDESNIVGGDQQAFDAVAQTFKLDWTHNLWSHFVRNIQLYSLEIIKVWFWGRAETFQKENLFLENEGKVMVVIWAWWIGGVGTHICRDWLLTYLVLLIFGNTFW